MTEFKEKFVAFVDILGFKSLVERAEAGSGLSLSELTKLVEMFGSSGERAKYEKYGPHYCPESRYVERHIDFRLTAISDCSIVSTEISPAGAINIVSHCWGVVIRFLQHGIMCRGYITRGRIYHTDNQVIGTGYQNAFQSESQVSVFKRAADERGTPFVEVDPIVCDYILGCDDSCMKEMFSRMTKSDGTGVALFPIKQLSHSFIIGGYGQQKFDPQKERTSNKNLRQTILNFKDRVMSFVDASKPEAVQKSEHYIDALDEQLAMCDRTDEMIDELCAPVSRTFRRY